MPKFMKVTTTDELADEQRKFQEPFRAARAHQASRAVVVDDDGLVRRSKRAPRDPPGHLLVVMEGHLRG